MAFVILIIPRLFTITYMKISFFIYSQTKPNSNGNSYAKFEFELLRRSNKRRRIHIGGRGGLRLLLLPLSWRVTPLSHIQVLDHTWVDLRCPRYLPGRPLRPPWRGIPRGGLHALNLSSVPEIRWSVYSLRDCGAHLRYLH